MVKLLLAIPKTAIAEQVQNQTNLHRYKFQIRLPLAQSTRKNTYIQLG